MNAYYYDIFFLVVFSISIILFLYKKKKKLTKDGIMYLYKTQIGVKIIDKIAKKNKKLLKITSYFILVTGYILMILMVLMLAQLTYLFVSTPQIARDIKVPPLMPLIPYLPELFNIPWLPPFYFTYWIIAIAVVAIVHEGAHGVFSRLYDIPVKSTGFGFLGPFLAFFVEPDEKEMEKSKIFPQLSILGAGVFANVLTTIICFLVMILFFHAAYSPSGVLFNSYSYELIDGKDVVNITNSSLTINNGQSLTLIKIKANNNYYYVEQSELVRLNQNEIQSIIGFNDFPAINIGLRGAITKINNQKVTNVEDLREELDKYNVGEKVNLTTNFEDKELLFEIELEEDPNQEQKPILGVGVIGAEKKGVGGFVYNLINLFKDPTTEYKPKANPELTLFIYNLFWWMVLINISVALVNMLPMGIFDGGRFFYLSILAITKKQKLSERIFKFATWIILLIFIILMLYWFVGLFI